MADEQAAAPEDGAAAATDEPTAQAAPEGAPPAEAEPAAEQASEVEAELAGLHDRLLRLQADFDNYRKRTQKELGEAGDRALGRFVEELLPVLDAIDAARAHGAAEVEQVAGLLEGLLQRQGLERAGADGDVFDPTRHEAVVHEAGDGPDGVQTVQVLRAGWLFRGRVLRAAMVKVVG